ncbi:MAG: alanine:cation symporter family protein, partial [Cetobacterium sp.]
VVVAMVYIGAIEQNFFVWSLADFGLGIMTIINILTISPLVSEAIVYLEKYEKKIKEYVKVNN